MRFLHHLGPVAGTITALVSRAYASFPNYQTVPNPHLDLSGLGRVALTGDFDAISVYQWNGQSESTASTNGSQSLFAQLPNGAFQTLATSDGSISAMCPFVRQDGTLFGVIVGGNFTTLSGTQVQGIALFNITNNAIVQLTGLSGSVNAIYCDQATDSVYVGGDFRGGNSTNAIMWVGSSGWIDLPFKGFNAPVYSITKADNGDIIFGGSFSGLSNMSVTSSSDSTDLQVINLSTANITASGSSTDSGLSDPHNILCKSSSQDGAGSSWLLQPNTAGYWQADTQFAFQPYKIRLYNTRQNGFGTRQWAFMNSPDAVNSILELQYTDPTSGQNMTCSNACPLSNDTNGQDFYFVRPITMNSFRIEINGFNGGGGGLDGIEIFQTDIFTYANTSFNEPACSVSDADASTSTPTGPWVNTPSGQSAANYLTASLQGPGVTSTSAQIVFKPDIKQSGNYTIIVYTPGCQQDGTCAQRGIANFTGNLTPGGGQTFQQNVFQTNQFEKYDQIYTGFIDAGTGGFRPTVTLQPLANQNSSIDLVALRVGFQLLDPTSIGLNGLYEYNPYSVSVSTDFKENKIDAIGINLDVGASVRSLLNINHMLFVGGAFSGQNSSNFIMINSNNDSVPLPGNGLNGAVSSLSNLTGSDLIYVGGSFDNTNASSVSNLGNVATFDPTNLQWAGLGAGVDGPVANMVPLVADLDSDTAELCMSVNGAFKNVQATGGHPSFAADGFAIWVPSRKQWLKNLGLQTQVISGQITATTNLTVGGVQGALMSGTIVDEGFAFQFAAELSTQNGNATLSSSGLSIQQAANTSSASSATTVSGIRTGLFDTSNNRNLSIFGGHFNAAGASNTTISNLAIINYKLNGIVSGLSPGIDQNSTFTALAVSGNTLYAGGSVTGNVANTPINGFVAWNLASNQFNSSLPPALGGSSVTVSAISPQPSGSDVYFAGAFDSAGGLGCPGVCIYTNGMWARPGSNFAGNVSGLLWQGNTKLLVVGNLTVGNSQTSIAMYDATAQTWSIPANANEVPGPVTVLTSASSDNSNYWVAGQSTNGSAFLMHYDGTNFQVAPQLDQGSVIQGLSVLSLSQGHGDNAFLGDTFSLLITGDLNVSPPGNCSGALFDGKTYSAFLLTNSGDQAGSLGSVITEQLQSFNATGSQLAVGFVVLIGLAIALALIFLLILIGLLIERHRRAAEGYRPAPQNYFEKTANMGRIPPERLFGNLNNSPSPRL